MTKFIPVAFALAAFTASLSPALAGNGGDRIGNVNGSQASFTQAAPVVQSNVAPVATYRYTDAEAMIIQQGSRER